MQPAEGGVPNILWPAFWSGPGWRRHSRTQRAREPILPRFSLEAPSHLRSCLVARMHLHVAHAACCTQGRAVRGGEQPRAGSRLRAVRCRHTGMDHRMHACMPNLLQKLRAHALRAAQVPPRRCLCRSPTTQKSTTQKRIMRGPEDPMALQAFLACAPVQCWRFAHLWRM